MNSTLNKTTRKIICDKLIAHRFSADIKAAETALYDCAERVFLAAFTKRQREFMSSAPEGFLPVSRGFYVISKDTKRFNRVVLGTFRPMPDALGKHNSPRPISADLFEQYEGCEAAIEEIKEQRDLARRPAAAVLNSCRTTKKLLEVWPEVEPFLTDLPGKSAVNLPVTTILNKTLNLPVDEAA